MSLAKVAVRYAKSLIDLAQERGELGEIYEDVLYVQEVIKNKDFSMLLKSPIISMDKKRGVFKALFGEKLSELSSKFLEIVLSKGRESALPSIMRAFVTQYKEIKGITDLKIITAEELTQKAQDAIKKKLIDKKMVSENVEVYTEVDESIVGGVILEFEGQRYDASISRKLWELKKDFRSNLYISQIIAK